MAQINKPTDYFRAKTYTGNSTDNTTITWDETGTNFGTKLWLWLKQRTVASQEHWLTDSIRGGSVFLESNSTNAESDAGGNWGYATNGFVLDDNARTNRGTMVGWGWRAATTPSKTYTVKVVDDSGNKYRFDDFGTSAVTLELSEGGTYTFDQSDSSNSGHPLRFYTASDKTGGEYTTGVTTNGTPGSSGAYTRITVAASAPTLYYQCSAHAGMGGQANTPTTGSFTNVDGTIQANISPNTTAGFSIVTYTGNGTAGATVGHGLGATPGMFVVKRRATADGWIVYHNKCTSEPETEHLRLDTNASNSDDNTKFNDTAPTSSVFSLGNDTSVNGSSSTYVAYCFSEVKGYSKFGSYTGNGNANGPFVYTGFKPAWLMCKAINTSGESWAMFDGKRDLNNDGATSVVYADTTDTETTGYAVDFLSNGFKHRSSNTNVNSTYTYVYMAFAENPLVGTNNIPATAR